ncbi:hypothetical protein J5N97_018958 [Dioscorea zingiberensis]|uniref:Uncharacterized protein n=1 Tax=Dioscorea zingiberensis TaxID=325984 RepID=A0A9D5HC14_9LILI|nr:hypothetical protein J5N97_018958 [Dioscorea zingiberensis]
MLRIRTIRYIARLSRAVVSRLLRTLPGAEVPADVPAGHVAVHVQRGEPRRRRFMVRAVQLNHPAFKELLLMAEEEYGFERAGPLTLPCDHSELEDALRRVSSAERPDPDDLQMTSWRHLEISRPLLGAEPRRGLMSRGKFLNLYTRDVPFANHSSSSGFS